MIVEEFESKFSGKIIVKKIWEWGWQYYVTTDNLTQSGGLIGDLWSPTIRNLKPARPAGGFEIRNCLILGLATGTLARMINKKFKNAKIIGIEIDPVMINIGKKYFNLDKIPNLKIINQDAKNFKGKHYDIIFVDLYIGDTPPSFLYSSEYLKKLRDSGNHVIINHLFYDDKKKKAAQVLITRLNKYFKNITLTRVLINVMIICS